jgi:hypothetical protein
MNYLMSIEQVREGDNGVYTAKYVDSAFEVQECTITFTPSQRRYWSSLDTGHRWRYATHLINRRDKK